MNNPIDPTLQIDKSLVRKSFDKAANTYNDAAILQLDTAKQLLSRLDYINIQPKTILDIGCGTGFVTQGLKKQYPKAKIISLDLSLAMLKKLSSLNDGWFKKSKTVCADAENLPFKDEQFDLVISSLTFQWCQNTQGLFSGIQRCLKKEGLLLFSSFGTDTLKELSAAWSQADQKVHVNQFEDMHNIGDALINMGFHLPVMDAERIVHYYDSVTDLMKELKAIGAHNVNAGRKKGLTGRQGVDAMKANYEALRTEHGIPTTYEVIYGIGWKKEISILPEAQVIQFDR
jgi:malonyl-CoA O-methyltransferase